MAQSVAWGIGKSPDGKEAAVSAAQSALDKLGTSHPVFAVTSISRELDVNDVVTGLSSQLGTTPIWGFTSPVPLSSGGEQPRSVVLGLIAGNGMKVQVEWYKDFSGVNKLIAQQEVITTMVYGDDWNGMLFIGDGSYGQGDKIVNSLSKFPYRVAGGLSIRESYLGKTYQIGGTKIGPEALSTLFLGGRLHMGIGIGHGWLDTGLFYKIDRIRDVWIHSLDRKTPAEIYSKIFGYEVRAWSYPPLNELVRLYPLGIELDTGSNELQLRAPLHVEVDGSFRMNSIVDEGKVAHVMVADREACLNAAQVATSQALNDLENAKPLIALVLIDAAWKYLFESKQGLVMQAIQSRLGDTPVIGGYTSGQIVRSHNSEAPGFHNENILIVVLGETEL